MMNVNQEQQTIERLQRYLSRNRRVRDALRDYRRARELTDRGLPWRQVKSTLTAFAVAQAPLTRVQLRNLLIREAFRFLERIAKERCVTGPATAAAMTADFLRVEYPHVCDDVTPDGIRKLIGYQTKIG